MESKEKLIEELLMRGVENIYPSEEFLRSKLVSGSRLTVYLGIDPTGPTLHMGHIIPLLKLRIFQKLGHQVVLLLGDFTAMIGDPTDKMATRVPLSREQVLGNASLYKDQASMFIEFGGENGALLKYNSEWLGKLSFQETLELMSHMTHAQMIKRDMFQKRIGEGKDLFLNEFLYPLMQGYDSVAMDVDGEVGGNDQTFNMLAGRDLLKRMKGKEKFVITTKLLADAEGIKMGKTTGNMIALVDTAEEMFGKVMSWTDGMILPGFELCTDIAIAQIGRIKKELEGGANPRDAKLLLAHEVVKLFKGEEAAKAGKEYFEKTIQHKGVPEVLRVVSFSPGLSWVDLLVHAGFAKSKSDARRLIEQGGVSFAVGEEFVKITDPKAQNDKSGKLKVGSHRFVEIEVGA